MRQRAKVGSKCHGVHVCFAPVAHQQTGMRRTCCSMSSTSCVTAVTSATVPLMRLRVAAKVASRRLRYAAVLRLEHLRCCAASCSCTWCVWSIWSIAKHASRHIASRLETATTPQSTYLGQYELARHLSMLGSLLLHCMQEHLRQLLPVKVHARHLCCC